MCINFPPPLEFDNDNVITNCLTLSLLLFQEIHNHHTQQSNITRHKSIVMPNGLFPAQPPLHWLPLWQSYHGLIFHPKRAPITQVTPSPSFAPIMSTHASPVKSSKSLPGKFVYTIPPHLLEDISDDDDDCECDSCYRSESKAAIVTFPRCNNTGTFSSDTLSDTFP